MVGQRVTWGLPVLVPIDMRLGHGLAPWPCGLLGSADSIPSRKDETETEKEETQTEHTPEATLEVAWIYIVATSGRGETEHG